MSNVQEIITNRMIELLEKGTAPWQQSVDFARASQSNLATPLPRPKRYFARVARIRVGILAYVSTSVQNSAARFSKRRTRLAGRVLANRRGTDKRRKQGSFSNPVLLRYTTAFNLHANRRHCRKARAR